MKGGSGSPPTERTFHVFSVSLVIRMLVTSACISHFPSGAWGFGDLGRGVGKGLEAGRAVYAGTSNILCKQLTEEQWKNAILYRLHILALSLRD